MKSIRRILVAITVLLLLAAIAVGVYLTFRANDFFSSPTQVRQHTSYERAFAASEPLPPAPVSLVSGMRVISREPDFEAELPEVGRDQVPALPAEIIRISGGEPARIGEGTIRLEYIGVGYSVPKTNFDWATSVPVKLFTPALDLVSFDDAFPNEPWRARSDFEGQWPEVRFIWTVTNIPHLKVLGWELFDATTHWSVANSRSYGQVNGGRIQTEGEGQLWRPMPVELVLSIAAGPVTETLIDPRAGEEVRCENGAIHLLEVYDREMSGWSSSSDGRTNTLRLRTASRQGYDPGHISSFLFMAWPSASPLPIDIDALNRDGKEIPAYGGGSSGRLLLDTARTPLADIHKIRVRCFQKIYRIVVSLPEIPGLPEENRGIENLFATKVPYMRFRYEYDFQTGVRDLIQMDSAFLQLNYPNGYFPVVFTNMTAEEIFLEMAKHAPEGDQFFPNPEINRIEVREPPIMAIWKRIKSLFDFR